MAENIIIYTTLESQYHGLGPTTPRKCAQKIILRENIIFENELPPNLIFYMLLDTSPTSSRNISFCRVWWASIQKVKKHYTFCPPRSDDYANLFAHERHLPAGQLSCHPRSSSGRSSSVPVQFQFQFQSDGLRIKPGFAGKKRGKTIDDLGAG